MGGSVWVAVRLGAGVGVFVTRAVAGGKEGIMEDCVSVGVLAVPGDQSPDTVMLAATTAAPTRSVSNFPAGTANTGENRAGIFAHNAASGLVVAEAVRAPVDV